MPDRWLTLKEVSEIIKVAEKTIRNRKADTHDLPRLKIGSRVFVSERQLRVWMMKRENQAEARVRGRRAGRRLQAVS